MWSWVAGLEALSGPLTLSQSLLRLFLYCRNKRCAMIYSREMLPSLFSPGNKKPFHFDVFCVSEFQHPPHFSREVSVTLLTFLNLCFQSKWTCVSSFLPRQSPSTFFYLALEVFLMMGITSVISLTSWGNLSCSCLGANWKEPCGLKLIVQKNSKF